LYAQLKGVDPAEGRSMPFLFSHRGRGVEQMSNTVIVVFVALLGVICRALVPFLQVLKDQPETTFDRKFVVPAIVTIVIAIFGLPLVLSGMPESAWAAIDIKGFVLVFVAAWGLTDIARAGQKQIG
jgi:hypothetical protein